VVYNICAAFPGWTREYVDGLGPKVQAEILGNIEGRARLEQWREYKRQQAQKRAARKRKSR
jgi:hypothetical protein